MSTGELTNQQKNVLDAIKHATMTRTGYLKRRISCECYDGRTVNSLAKRGLILWGRGSFGEGYAVKEAVVK